MTKLQKFIEQAGFKVLALARLSSVEYSIVLYLINCFASRFEDVLTTYAELSSLIGYDETELKNALEELQQRRIIWVRQQEDYNDRNRDLYLGLELNISEWIVDSKQELESSDAIVFPFRRSSRRFLNVYEESDDKKEDAEVNAELTWRRVFEAFVDGRELDDQDRTSAQKAAQILVEAHPVDQVMLMIRHFGERIPSLSMLASSWKHYHELFLQETEQIDLAEAREKNRALDEKLRESVEDYLKQYAQKLNDEERTVLDILLRHRSPRRQLFWAYQARSRYPNLVEFFAKNKDLMLPVTSKGQLVPKRY